MFALLENRQHAGAPLPAADVICVQMMSPTRIRVETFSLSQCRSMVDTDLADPDMTVRGMTTVLYFGYE